MFFFVPIKHSKRFACGQLRFCFLFWLIFGCVLGRKPLCGLNGLKAYGAVLGCFGWFVAAFSALSSDAPKVTYEAVSSGQETIKRYPVCIWSKPANHFGTWSTLSKVCFWFWPKPNMIL